MSKRSEKSKASSGAPEKKSKSVGADEVVPFVLFGLGRAGSIHGGNVMRHPRARLAYIVELDTAKAAAYVAARPELAHCVVLPPDRAHEALADPDVKAALCASTTSTHEGIIRACFKHGKPVFSEKPVAETVERTMAVCKESMETGVPLFCGFNRRSDSQFIDLKRRVDEGVVGRTMMIKSTSRDFPTNCPLEYIKISGGQFVDQSVHDIDICLWIAKERPHTVFAVGHAFYPDIAAVPDTDTVMINLQFPSGVMATIDNSRRATFGYDTRLEVYGDKAMVTLDNLRASAVTVHSADGENKDCIYDHFSSRFRDAYYSELDHFIDYLSGKETRLRITAEEAYAAVRVSQAAADSYRLKKPIELKWD